MLGLPDSMLLKPACSHGPQANSSCLVCIEKDWKQPR